MEPAPAPVQFPYQIQWKAACTGALNPWAIDLVQVNIGLRRCPSAPWIGEQIGEQAKGRVRDHMRDTNYLAVYLLR